MLNLTSRFWQWLNRPDQRIRYKSGRLIRIGREDTGPWEDLLDFILPLWFQRIIMLLIIVLFGAYLAVMIARLTGMIS